MTFQEFLQQQRAWQPAIDWAKGKTLKEFWETCIFDNDTKQSIFDI